MACNLDAMEVSQELAEAMPETRMVHWTERWCSGKIGWHKQEINPWLLKYQELLKLSSNPKRIFVPLCGKSLDLKWFYDDGHSVVGIEGIEKAVIEFFEENHISYLVDSLSFGKLYKTHDNRLNIYACDLFTNDLHNNILGTFDVIWDRGSFVAICIKDREKYCNLMKSLLNPTLHYLLATIQYDGIETVSGPPRCIPVSLVDQLFGDVFNHRVLETIEITDERICNEWKVGQCFETCSLLTPKETLETS